jgi:protoporphyrinogen oxidase
VPTPDLHEVVLGALEDRGGAEGYNARFLYPRRGGIEALVRALARGLEPRVHTGTAIERIDLARRRLRLSSGDDLGFGRLVSCAPLPELVRMTDPVPDGVRRAARALRVASVYNLNLGIVDRGSDKHWVYVPEDRFAVYRFGFASNFTKDSAPAGMANIYTELSYRRGRPPDRHAVRERVIRDLLAIGVIHSRREIVAEQAFDLPFGYAIFDAKRDQAVSRIRKFFESRQIFPVGRYGRWEYSSMEDALHQGLTISESLRKSCPGR